MHAMGGSAAPSGGRSGGHEADLVMLRVAQTVARDNRSSCSQQLVSDLRPLVAVVTPLISLIF
jgi:hypothetical protein